MKGYRVSTEGLERLCTEAFVADGMPLENAKIVAASLIFADLRGVSSHGVVRLKTYLERVKKEHWNRAPKFCFSTLLPAVCMMDGDDGFGALVGTAAMEKAMELARIYGIGVCSVRKSSHFGMASYYPLLAAKRNMIGFCCTNGMPNLAHFGSKEGMLGTNPFSIAIPVADGEPLALDIACSVTARGNIANAKREGVSIPMGWAMDRDGNPTTDPVRALAGSVLPFGGHKGSGMAVVIDILSGILSGAANGARLREGENGVNEGGPNVGHLFMALSLEAFGETGALKARIAQALEELRCAPTAPGFEKILLPGDLESERYAYHEANGIPIGAGAWKEFCDVCGRLGIQEDPEKYVLAEEEIAGKQQREGSA